MISEKAETQAFSRCVLGTAGLGGVWGKVNPEESVRCILEALDSGIAAIDTAPAYGDAELFIGKALQQWKGAMPQISTKAGRLKTYANDNAVYDYSTNGLERSVMNSLEYLDVPSIDILFLHEPAAIAPDEATRIINDLIGLKSRGLAKKLGIGGNTPDWFKQYIKADVFDVLMEYNRLNAICLDALKDSVPGCENKGIAYYAASPLHMGLLGCSFETFTNDVPVWLNQQQINRAKKIKQVAGHYNLPLPTIAHRFLLNLPYRFKIVTGAADHEQLQQTLSDFSSGPLPAYIYNEIIESLNE